MTDSNTSHPDAPAAPEPPSRTPGGLDRPAESTPAAREAAPTGIGAASPALGDRRAPDEERVWRGVLFALPIIPAGVIAWVVIWQWGFISAIVALGVSLGATALYRLGSGGRVGRGGVAAILGVTLVTLVLAFLGGIAADLAAYLEVDFISAIRWPEFWDLFAANVFANPDMWAGLMPDLLMALLFAGLGCFGVFRAIAKEAKTGRIA